MPTTKMPQNDKPKNSKSSKSRDLDQAPPKEVDVQVVEPVQDEASSDNCDECADCGKAVLHTHKSLQCDGCGFWHHASCENVRKELYALLCDLDTSDYLLWLCKKCMVMHRKFFAKVQQSEEAVVKLEEGHKRLEEKVEAMIEVFEESQRKLDDRMMQMSISIDDKLGALSSSEMSCSTGNTKAQLNMIEVFEESQRKLEDMMKTQTEEARKEEEDMRKRKANVIVHGLDEPKGNTAADRENDDKIVTENLLHVISSDNVSVNQVTRLDAVPLDSAAKSRPLRITFESEQSRDQVLKKAKNLKGKGGVWGKVFIHQDLTPRQRETRKKLIQELKDRKDNGEPNLIIVNGKIVTRRTQAYMAPAEFTTTLQMQSSNVPIRTQAV